VVARGTGKRARIFGEGDIAGKTGTINSNEAVWFAGYTPEIAGVAMISIDNTKNPFIKSRKLRKPGDYFRGGGVKGYRVPSTGQYLEGSGSGDAGQEIWRPVMLEYLKKVPNTSFNDPPRRIEVGRQVTVPNVYGLGISAARRKLEQAGFTVETQYVYHPTIPPYGFVGWNPSPGQTISEFGTIFLMRSKGKDPAIAEAQKKAEELARKKAEEEEERKRREKEKQPPGPR
jgi:membrane carboxypeptidase/penicillin-binding protein